VATANPWLRGPIRGDLLPALHSVPPPPEPAPDPPAGLRLWRPTGRATLYWVGASGGAGESTLAAHMPGTAAAGHRWPTPAADPARCVLVARTTAAGLGAAQAALAQYAAGRAGNTHLLGVLLSADTGGRRPKQLQRLIDRISGGAPVDGRGRPQVWQLPFIDAWRLPVTDPPAPTDPRVTAVLEQITDLLPTPH
jgi:hypothetical protein